jgi:hypothetical protein
MAPGSLKDEVSVRNVYVLAGMLAIASCGVEEASESRPSLNPITITASHLHQHDVSAHVAIQNWMHHRIESPFAFKQVGLLFDATQSGVRYRVEQQGVWSSWRPVEVTWSEGKHHVGRILLDAPAERVELKSEAILVDGRLDFWPEVVATSRLTRDLPVTLPSLDAPLINAIAPRSLVIPRSEWGARNPDKVCGVPHEPYRMSIHHTAGPTTDGPDPAARLRQIQAYHIDSNGWCDIGYHFVVTQGGALYQGISNEARTGIHVGNQNTGNIGISLIGNFQEQTVSTAQLNATAAMARWVSDTYNIALNRTNVKGHQEWPGQSTACPGNDMMAKMNTMLSTASGIPGPDPEPPPVTDVEITARWIGDIADFYQDGSSAGKPDFVIGDRLQAEIIVTNKSTGPLRGVRVDYWVEAPFLKPTNYVIQTDSPGRDQTVWVTNDADSAEGNPAKDAMPSTASLVMYAFGAGESKRILIDLEATQYSLGAVDHPDIRAWVRHIDDVYADQTEWDQAPALNTVNKTLQSFAQSDVLSPYEWQFDAGEVEQLEGWSTCSAGTRSALVAVDAGVLRLVVDGDAGCVVSPAWTSVDAQEWDQMVLKMRTDVLDHRVAVFWATEGAEFEAARSLEFKASPSADTYVIPLGQQSTWTGVLQQLRVDPLVGANQGTANIDAIFFQSSTRQQTSAAGEVFVGLTPVEIGGEATTDPNLDPNLDPGEREPEGGASTAATSNGCSSGSSIPVFWLLFSILGIRRRK